ELRYFGITSRRDANRYLQQTYMPEWNKKRTVEPISTESRYRPIPAEKDLRDVFCIKEERVVNRDQTIQWDNERYRIETIQFGNMWKKEVSIHRYEDGSFAVFYGDKKLELKQMLKTGRRWKRS